MRANLFYCYNYQQSNFILQHGIAPVEIGRGNKGDIYVVFPRNEKFEEVFTKWIERGKEIKTAI
jgi:hypothetical protein